MESQSSCSHRRNMLVADSKPLTKPHSSSEQPDKKISTRWVRTIKWIWQVTLCGLIKAKTSINYMHIWLVELNAILHKANFTLSFQTLFFSTSHEILPWNASKNIFSTQVHQFFTYKIGTMRSLVDVLAPILRIVRNRGHGYDHSLTLSRGCALSPLDSINPF